MYSLVITSISSTYLLESHEKCNAVGSSGELENVASVCLRLIPNYLLYYQGPIDGYPWITGIRKVEPVWGGLTSRMELSTNDRSMSLFPPQPTSEQVVPISLTLRWKNIGTA